MQCVLVSIRGRQSIFSNTSMSTCAYYMYFFFLCSLSGPEGGCACDPPGDLPGDPGPPGCPGDPGDQGQKGFRGPRGEIGLIGERGVGGVTVCKPG